MYINVYIYSLVLWHFTVRTTNIEHHSINLEIFFSLRENFVEIITGCAAPLRRTAYCGFESLMFDMGKKKHSMTIDCSENPQLSKTL